MITNATWNRIDSTVYVLHNLDMQFTPGSIIAITAVLLFYLRLIVLQRQKAKASAAIKTGSSTSKKRWKSSSPSPALSKQMEMHRPLLVAAGVITILVGAGFAAIPALGPAVQDWWWLPVTLGILVMSFGIR